MRECTFTATPRIPQGHRPLPMKLSGGSNLGSTIQHQKVPPRVRVWRSNISFGCTKALSSSHAQSFAPDIELTPPPTYPPTHTTRQANNQTNTQTNDETSRWPGGPREETIGRKKRRGIEREKNIMHGFSLCRSEAASDFWGDGFGLFPLLPSAFLEPFRSL